MEKGVILKVKDKTIPIFKGSWVQNFNQIKPPLYISLSIELVTKFIK